ncbi:MAG: glycosyltransferase family 4 protein [Clostridia bacterium]|nr:glycosyltransferase family 4 protein [Clostridia bacterium]
MIGHKRIPSREGGVEIVVEELSTRLVKNGHIVDAYNRKGNNIQDENADKDKRNLTEYEGINIKSIPTFKKKGLEALAYSFLATIKALFGKYDVIHYHAEGPAAMLWLPHFLGIRTVATIHGLDWQRAKWGGFAKKYLKFGEKIAAKYADKVIVLSKNMQDYFLKEYGRDTEFIPNGIEKPEYKKTEIIKEKYNLEKNDYILSLGRIVPEKGIHYLLEAFKKIDTDKKLVIAGGASHTNEYLEEIKKKAAEDDRVIMTGFVQGQELEELFSNCLSYCLPSDIEGMPLSLLEAMSYGKTCIVSNIPENMEVVQHYAIPFEMSNIEALKNRIESVIDGTIKIEPERIQDHILSICDWDAVVEKTEKLYIKENK